ncbi:uncharacterized protein TRIVIDRAFT_27804 [Trichoderma virens Gv29-8]|uniref:ADP-ribosylhydrolase ARH3 n=1 Tax=Hypocrea virens (strain Gv29-8 / FGSC 10586) TaxID=413071 RepID=G9MSW0_HYPVG|nr:uncharacterized protein TRIVIDRAFT_27804 [Trichoderma virens Gv29-8]EHK23057.1 hypothetical protein TRIVIDRAFT_27804 [Trichoderma virens Gv29-8]
MAYISTPTRLQRSIGALLGVHAGDSLGSTLEFKSHANIKESHPTGLRDIVGGGAFQRPAGAATDDTDMTRGVLLAYFDHQQLLDNGQTNNAEGHDVAKLAAQYFLAWLSGDWPGRQKGRRPVDIGGATLRGLEMFKRTQDPERAGAGIGQAGNGSLMRCIPTGIFQTCRREMTQQSMRISAITHDDARCTISCAAYNTVVYALLKEKSPREAVDEALLVAKSLEENCNQDTGCAVEKAIRLGTTLSVADMAENGPESFVGKAKGYVLESLSIAVAALMDIRPLEDVLVDVVRIGGDTDTNAAIAGGLLGARDGVDAIPPQWREKLQFREEFERITKLLVESIERNDHCKQDSYSVV